MGSQDGSIDAASCEPRACARARSSSGAFEFLESGAKPQVLGSFSEVVSDHTAETLTLNGPGMSDRVLLRACASLWRSLDGAGTSGLLLAIARESGAQSHLHGIVCSPPPPRLLLQAWRTATRGAARAARTVHSAQVDPERGGLPGWLAYSTRGLAASALASDVLAFGTLEPPWANALAGAGLRAPPRCAWCLAPLQPAQVGRAAKSCGDACRQYASRRRRRQREALAMVANPTPQPEALAMVANPSAEPEALAILAHPLTTLGNATEPPSSGVEGSGPPADTATSSSAAVQSVASGAVTPRGHTPPTVTPRARELADAAAFAVEWLGVEASLGELERVLLRTFRGSPPPTQRETDRALRKALVSA